MYRGQTNKRPTAISLWAVRRETKTNYFFSPSGDGGVGVDGGGTGVGAGVGAGAAVGGGGVGAGAALGDFTSPGLAGGVPVLQPAIAPAATIIPTATNLFIFRITPPLGGHVHELPEKWRAIYKEKNYRNQETIFHCVCQAWSADLLAHGKNGVCARGAGFAGPSVA